MNYIQMAPVSQSFPAQMSMPIFFLVSFVAKDSIFDGGARSLGKRHAPPLQVAFC